MILGTDVANAATAAGQPLPGDPNQIAVDYNNAFAAFPSTAPGFYDGSQTLWILGGARNVLTPGWQFMSRLCGLSNPQPRRCPAGTPNAGNLIPAGLSAADEALYCTPPVPVNQITASCSAVLGGPALVGIVYESARNQLATLTTDLVPVHFDTATVSGTGTATFNLPTRFNDGSTHTITVTAGLITRSTTLSCGSVYNLEPISGVTIREADNGEVFATYNNRVNLQPCTGFSPSTGVTVTNVFVAENDVGAGTEQTPGVNPINLESAPSSSTLPQLSSASAACFETYQPSTEVNVGTVVSLQGRRICTSLTVSPANNSGSSATSTRSCARLSLRPYFQA